MAATPLSLTPFFVCLRSFGFPGRFSFGVSPFRLWMVGYLVFGLVVLLWLSGSFFWSVFRYKFARLRGMRPFASVVPYIVYVCVWAMPTKQKLSDNFFIFEKVINLYVTSCRPTPTLFPSINTTAMAVTTFSGVMYNIEITRIKPTVCSIKLQIRSTMAPRSQSHLKHYIPCFFLTFSILILTNFEAKELSICITTDTARLYLTTHTHK